MEPIRVLHVVGNMNAGGLETLIMNWYRNIDREHIQFDFLTNTSQIGYYEKEILAMGGRVYHTTFIDDKNIFKYRADVRRFFAEHREFSVVHGHHSALGSTYLKEAKRAGIPCRISHSHIASYSKTVKGMVKHVLMRWYGKYATHHFACSMAAGRYMYGENSKFTVINNGIDTERFAFSADVRAQKRAELGLEEKCVLIHVGRFHDQKNHTFLVDIFNAVHSANKDAVLLLVGVGPLEDGIKAKVRELGLEESVRFMGNRSNVNELLCAADAFLFPSLYEGLPLTLVEAQTSGVPVVCSTAVTDETKLTEHYRALSLSAPVSEWAEAVLEATASDHDRKTDYLTVREKHYDCHDVAAGMCKFYAEQNAVAAAIGMRNEEASKI